MAITGSTDLGGGLVTVTVDADPSVTPVNVPTGSIIIWGNNTYKKLDDGETTNVNLQVESLRKLIHFIDGGPAEGFLTGAYRQTTGTVFPTAIVWYDVDNKKIVEKLITWTGANPTTITWKVYDNTETLTLTVTDTISYSNVFETSRTRTIT